MDETGWTIDELAQQAAETLAACGVQAPNGRVTALPDRRVIRWYATLGLLDRPLRTGGRTARYGSRHLLQLVAVKRRQAQGRSLAEIQAELTGATDATLREAAGLPAPGALATNAPAALAALAHSADSLVVTERTSSKGSVASSRSWSTGNTMEATDDQDRREFWRERPAPETGPAADVGPVGTPPPDTGPMGTPPPDAGPVDTTPPDTGPVGTPPPDAGLVETLPADLVPADAVALRYAVALHPAASLTLPAPPGPDDLIAIQSAARPLLELLARRGLLTHPRRPR